MATRIGEHLLADNLVSDEALQKALSSQRTSGRRVGEELCSMGLLSEKQILSALSKQLGLQQVELSGYPMDENAVRCIARDICIRCSCIAIGFDEANSLQVATADPLDSDVIEEIEFLTGSHIELVLATNEEIGRSIDRYYDFAQCVNELIDEVVPKVRVVLSTGHSKEPSASQMRSAPVVKIIQELLAECVNKGASDIHLEPYPKLLRAKIRVDGRLRPLMNIPK